MRRNLKDAVSGGIDNKLSCFKMLVAIVTDDLRPRIRAIAQNAVARALCEGLQHLLGKSVGIGGQGLR